MIFKVVHSVPLRETNDNIDAHPKFKDVDDTLLRFVFLLYDYTSPYSRIPLSIREEQVFVACGLNDKTAISKFKAKYAKQMPSIKDAFNKLQHNAEYEALDACKAQVGFWNELLKKENKSEKELDIAFKIVDKLPTFLERIKKLEEIVGYREIYENEAEDDSTSLESFMNSEESE